MVPLVRGAACCFARWHAERKPCRIPLSICHILYCSHFPGLEWMSDMAWPACVCAHSARAEAAAGSSCICYSSIDSDMECHSMLLQHARLMPSHHLRPWHAVHPAPYTGSTPYILCAGAMITGSGIRQTPGCCMLGARHGLCSTRTSHAQPHRPTCRTPTATRAATASQGECSHGAPSAALRC
jgi:hypothetical protein